MIVNSYKTTGETTYDDYFTPVLSLLTDISYFIKPYCWIIFFSLLQPQFYVNLIFKRSKNFSLHTFSFFLLDHHKRWLHYLFLYYSEIIRKILLGTYHTRKCSPTKLTDSVCRQFCSTKISPVIIEFHFHGTCEASNRGSRFYLRFYLKKQSLFEFLVFSRKNFIQKEIWKNVADGFYYIIFTNNE